MLKPTDLILVCLLRAGGFGWYAPSAPKVVAVDYLAFYQPSAFAERGGQIEFVAQVKGHELTTRGELLRDEADHAREGRVFQDPDRRTGKIIPAHHHRQMETINLSVFHRRISA
ncbi:hypothetical protein [Candidatus Villigracilis saccharophilus]|uniref:hypothetical protein n=1 Tax=Candidatus Villigracilis saccharophilus TaxID=3140684 RepID=UPI003134D982|nr:hypothetical protein [Anaerolineales bacterium]